MATQASQRATSLVVVRHGETSANTDGVWHGSTDTPLTARGHAQARCVAERLARECSDVVAIYSSDLRRALDTATPIARALGLEVQTERGLREYDLGSWEGKTYRELLTEHRLWDHMRADPHYAPHGGESPLGVAERLCATLRAIALRHEGSRVVVVSHGGALSLAFGLLLDRDYGQWRRVMDNCAVTELTLEPLALLRFNDKTHLDAL
ncbi:MAG TPA: histidine phosphatase family protein [Myxococcota bacterium]|jgi:probable phosphoglycerate mutase|nr:histidine phosphatase family protein [Myxococcota bacterium]